MSYDIVRGFNKFTLHGSVTSSPIELLSKILPTLLQEERDALFNLSFVHLPPDLSREDPSYEAQLALAITQTNAIAADNRGIGVFPTVARLNHGCSASFNAVYSWREEAGELFVHALKPIKTGEELLTTYMDTKKPTNERR
jgi:SET domain